VNFYSCIGLGISMQVSNETIYWTRTYEGSYKGVEFIWESLSCGFNKLFYKKNGHFVQWGVGQTGPCNLKFVQVIDQTDWTKINTEYH